MVFVKKTETNIECEIVGEEFEEEWNIIKNFSNYEISDFGNCCRNKKIKDI